ncbi:MAG TPA: SusD/RagB family nutrient-binding outer membrane lipoprotein [Gemmatimonadaceae bacterium]
MKRRLLALAVAGAVGLTASCQDFLDVNTNPNGPETVAANLYLSPMLHWMATGQQWDGRGTAQYSQMLTQSALSTYDAHGPNYNTDFGGQQWRDVYWTNGQNLIDMMNIAEAEKRWDILGAGYVIKAWGWLQLSSIHGNIIVKEAFNQGTFDFNYDSEEYAYQEVQRLLDSAIVYLGKTDGAVDATYMGRGDKMYNGDRTKWLKFAHGAYAIALSHYSNKSSYDPAKVIAHVDQSLASNADDALWGFPNTSNDDRNFQGPTRSNYTSYYPTLFMVGLMNGTVFPGAVDPRMSRMLAPSVDSVYRGLDIAQSIFSLPASQRPMNPFGYPTAPPPNSPGIYLFADQVKAPLMTYSQLQFVKAEAAYKKGDKATALAAYTNGVSSHIDFVNARNRDDNQHVTQISATEKAAFLANPAVIPASPAQLTLSMIMTQKFIAEWAWAYNEAWMDLKRYHYVDKDPATGEAVFPGYQIPTTLHSFNNGKLAYRLRPRYNSEYVWNEKGLDKIGGLALDYHTKPLWIVTP